MKTAIIYTRVSTKDQAEKGTSLPMQERDCRAWCERNGYTVLKPYTDEGESAKTADRPQFIQACLAAINNKVDAFVVWKLDRFSRDIYDGLNIRKQLADNGCKLISIMEPTADDDSGELHTQMLMAFNAWDNKTRSKRATKGSQETIAKGGWCWVAPNGYIQDRDGNLPILKPDGMLSNVIATAFRGVINGTHTKSDAMAILRSAGLSPQTACKMFNMPIYGGIIRTKLSTDDLPAAFPGIITAEEWFRLEAKFSGVVREKRNYANDDFPLTSVLFCHECGTPLRGAFTTKKSGKRYPYYSCQNKQCPNKNECLRSEKVDSMLNELLVTSESLTREFEESLRRATKCVMSSLHEIQKQRDSVAASIERIKKKKLKLAEGFADDVVDREDYIAKTKAYTLEIATLSAKLTQQKDPSDVITEVCNHLSKWRNFADVYAGLDTISKKRLLKLLFGGLTVVENKLIKLSKDCANAGVLARLEGQIANGTPKGSRTPLTRMRTN